MDPYAYYLCIPEGYCRWLGGLRWSDAGDAIEYQDGGTFALAPEIGLFIAGFATHHELVHFGFVLHLLHLLGYGKIAPPPQFLALRKAFRETGRPIHNAGVLCGRLCQRIPSEPGDLDVKPLFQRLADESVSLPYPTWFVDPFAVRVSEPPLNTAEFESRVLAELERLRPDEIAHWLQHGRAPVGDAVEQLARQVVLDRPRLFGKILAFLGKQPRLSGVLPFVPQLLSALALPPRLAEPELGTGGYADVATRGEPERILPSQFAMDEIEFLRRFAQNELLYFRREEPETQVREQLVILLDQGVRTWGVVRLILSAAALALGKLTMRKQLPFLLAGTSSTGRCIDPLKETPKDVAALLAASDLSANPGLPLETVLQQPSKAVRDVVLLTHPRNLIEPDVNAAARRADHSTRVFALAVDEQGAACFSQIKHGFPTTVLRFQIVFPKTETSSVPRLPRTDVSDWKPLPPWQGDVEPVGYPFPSGLSGPVRRHGLAFDAEGKWLLALATNGILHAFKLDGSWAEILPRGHCKQVMLEEPEAVVGVAGGFVVIGRTAEGLVAAHYALSSRRCTVRRLAPADPSEPCKYFYFREYHTVVAQASERLSALDISIVEHPELVAGSAPSTRLQQAIAAAKKYILPPPRVPIGISNLVRPKVGPWVCLDRDEGRLTIEGMDRPWNSCVPLADGKPLLKGCLPSEAQCIGDILALTYCPGGKPDHLSLLILRGPQGIPVCEYPYSQGAYGPFVLSSDGRLLARQIDKKPLVQVHDLNHDAISVLTTPKARHHSNLKVTLGGSWLTVEIGKLVHLVHWHCGPLVLRQGYSDKERFLAREITAFSPEGSPVIPQLARKVRGSLSGRFALAAQGHVALLIDKLGQLAIFDLAGKLVCMFCFWKEQAAAWMPNGTRYGPANLSGGPETPDALSRLGEALRSASERGRSHLRTASQRGRRMNS